MNGADARSALEHAHEAWVALDAFGNVVEWNSAAERTFGWTRADAIGHPVADLIIPPRMRAAHIGGITRLARGGEPRMLDRRLELVAMHRAGHELPVELTISAIDDGGRRLYSALLHDITDRRRAEAYRNAQMAMAQAFSAGESPEEAVVRTTGSIAEALDFARAIFWSRESPDDQLVCRYVWNASNASEGVQRIGERAGPNSRAARALMSGAPVIEERDRAVDGPEATVHGLRSVIAVALADPDSPAGVLEFYSRQAQYIDDGDLMEMTAGLARQIGLMTSALTARLELIERFRELAHTDELTGLLNRRGWDESVQREMDRARRHGYVFGVALLDLDHFKTYNDRHGHRAGDQLLRALAQGWTPLLRGCDLLARWGGEEFGLLLTGPTSADSGVALSIVERLRSAIPDDQTCSAGLAIWNGHEGADGLVTRADDALYAAKRRGRGRTVVAD